MSRDPTDDSAEGPPGDSAEPQSTRPPAARSARRAAPQSPRRDPAVDDDNADGDRRLLADVRSASAGDGAALARLVPTLYRVAGQMLVARLHAVDPEDRADLISDGVVKAIEQLHAARPVSAAMFRAWVRAVVWRAALDAQRTRGRRDAAWRAAPLDAYGAGERRARPGGPVRATAARPDGGPADEWDEWLADTPLATLARLAVDAQRNLPPGAAFILWAHLVADAGWAEVAVLVGTTPAGAKRRYQRALAVLRAAVWRGVPDLPSAVRAAALARLATLDPRGENGA